MNITALFADSVAVADNKLYVQGGGWHAVDSPALPFVIPNLGVALMIDADASEFAAGRRLTMRLADSDGQSVKLGQPGAEADDIQRRAEVIGNLQALEPGGGDGVSQTLLLAINFQSVRLEREAVYHLEISIDDAVCHRVPLFAKVTAPVAGMSAP